MTSGPGACSETVTPTIELINPCEDTPTGIETRTIADQNVILDDPSGLQDFNVGDFTDTVSAALGPADGITYCGTRSYSFDKPNLVPYAVDDLWRLQALTSDDYIGGNTELVTVTVTVQYADATTVSRDFTFNIIINCTPVSIAS